MCGCVGGWVGGWVDGWVGGWVGGADIGRGRPWPRQTMVEADIGG